MATAKGSEAVNAYLAKLPADQRAALQALRATIKAAAPEAEEAMVYGVPGCKLKKKGLVCYAAFKAHCGFYPLSPAVLDAFAGELGERRVAEGTIHFTPDEPLPADLVTRMVKARLKEVSG